MRSPFIFNVLHPSLRNVIPIRNPNIYRKQARMQTSVQAREDFKITSSALWDQSENKQREISHHSAYKLSITCFFLACASI